MEINEIIKTYNSSGPRYTSYPPATHFNNSYSNEDFVSDIIFSNSESPENISFYIHIPFCPQICHFCGCTTEKGFTKPFIRKYIDALMKEITYLSSYIDKKRKVSQIHWGGGTPNAISMRYIEEVTSFIKNNFQLTKDYEMAIECSPAYLDYKHVEQLKNFGFNRISLGIQDFNKNVLKAINRKGSRHPIEDLVKKIKFEGFSGTNIDLIYGLPLQSVKSFKKTIEKATELDVDRIVTFSYAHLPSVFTRQKVLDDIGFPSTLEKAKMYLNGFKHFTSNNYNSIGIDHYAKKDDELSIALNNKTLGRNFQGYCTKSKTGQVYGFGASSISQLTSAYSQNIKNGAAYIKAIEKNNVAVLRGYKVNKNQKVVRDVVNSIMCNNYLDFNEISEAHSIKINTVKEITNYFDTKLKEFEKNGFINVNKNYISINESARLVVRNIAMQFDPLISNPKGIYSKTI